MFSGHFLKFQIWFIVFEHLILSAVMRWIKIFHRFKKENPMKRPNVPPNSATKDSNG